MSEAVLRQPPAALDAEMSALGSALISTSAVPKLLAGTHRHEFGARANQMVYAAIASLAARGRKIDVTTVPEEMRTKGWLERAGGTHYVNQLAESVATAHHVEDYCLTVVEKAQKRQLIEVCDGTMAAAYLDQTPAEELIATLSGALHALAKRRDAWEIISAAVAFAEQAQEIEDRKSPPTIFLNSGDLDEVLHVHPGDLLVLAGQTSAGKSASALHLLLNAALAGVPALMVTLEMSRRQCEDRILSAATDVPLKWIARRQLYPEQLERVREWGPVLKSLSLQFVEKSGGSVETLCAMIRESADRHGTKFVVVDQLNRLQPKKWIDSERERYDYCTRHLKDNAMQCGTGTLLLHQLNRLSNNAPVPMLEHLRGTSGIEQDADAVLFVHRPDRRKSAEKAEEEPDEVRLEWINGKQRNGPAGWKRQRKFKKSTQRITEDDTHYDEETERRPYAD